MVYIKKLDVYGFKSFGFRNTSVAFEKGLVAVTGPNGSGKSNILDAIMFAIGENSPKVLRVDKFQSLFHDSQNSSHRLLRVTLTLDNTDRGLPVDADSVTLTRQMEGVNGESQYMLSGKPVSKAAIMDVLEIVLSAPNKLNIVQQGMVTRISELNSEERRKIIEDIVGLSYFDEKKTEAVKQLDEADRRLEVAFARMGEIRKRVDELEVERTEQLRYDYINSELKRFRAAETSNNIRTLRQKRASSQQTLDTHSAKMSSLTKQLEELRAEIDKLDSDKNKFMQEVDTSSKSKAQVATKITSAVHDLEKGRAMTGENERRIVEIERRLNQIGNEITDITEKIDKKEPLITVLAQSIEEKKKSLETLKTELAKINAELESISKQHASALLVRNRLESRLKRVSTLKAELELNTAKIEEKLKTTVYRRNSTSSFLESVQAEINQSKEQISAWNTNRLADSSRLAELSYEIVKMSKTKSTIEQELIGSSGLISKAESLAVKFEERAHLAKSAMVEDTAIAEIMKVKEDFGIVGLVHDLLKWNKNYERPVLAAGAEWMKSFVVPDVKSMITLASYAKKKKLPRLRIIPLDIASRFKSERPSLPSDANVIASLSELVYSEYSGLTRFLFSDTILVKTSTTAYTLGKKGYRTVSVEGELFEPSGISMSLDFGSKISSITKAILVADSVESLRSMLERLGKLVDKANLQLTEVREKTSELESEKIRLEIGLGNLEGKLDSERISLAQKEKAIVVARDEDRAIIAEAAVHASELEKYGRRLTMVQNLLGKIVSKLEQIGGKQAIEAELVAKGAERNKTVAAADSATLELNREMAEQNSAAEGMNGLQRQILNYKEEGARLEQERENRQKSRDELSARMTQLEMELRSLREQEQQIIDSSGTAYTVLQEYERKIKSISENERKLAREYNTLERESALLRKDISDVSVQEERLSNDLLWLGYKELQGEMDARLLIKALDTELEELKGRINLRADETYTQVIDGYRGMSGRRNELESERNSIISFIDQVAKEKKDVFMEAFKKVDDDIRSTFSDMTSGSAWLEIEDQDDIFGSGVMLLVQFPNKTVPRESTSLSGGEKTIAAIVFLLALQALKPSPFYLMDEVDAHLDAQNTDRLSKILYQRSRNNQIIMVTLKDSTVARASLVYGVYARDGTSYVVKYRNPDQLPLAQISSESKV